MLKLIIKQRRAIELSFILTFVLGLLALDNLGTAELPEPPGSGINITAVLPGASPQEMDKKVARLLQNAIKDISGVKSVSSSAKESFLSMSVSFSGGNADYEAMQREVTQAVSQVPDMPADLEGPFVSRKINRLFPVMTFLFEGGDDLQRHKVWYEIKQSIKNIKAVDLIDTMGDREQRIEIRLKTLKLQQLGLRIDQVSRLIQQAITDQSAGRQESFMSLQRIRVKAQPKSLSDLNALPININGTLFRLSQLADIEETLAPKTMEISHHGKKAWYVNVYRRTGTKVSDLSTALHSVIEQYNQRFAEQGQDMQLTVVQDRNVVVDETLSELRDSIIFGMLLVLMVLWLFFGFHHALYAAIGIPFAFFATFIAMDALGLSLNTLTLFGLVLVCGMIVDDAIVVLESVFAKIEQGEETFTAINNGIKDVMPAVLCSTATTTAAFLPLIFMSGDMGSFISQIPKVAILALLASLVECFVILPIHIYNRQKNKHSVKSQDSRFCNIKMAALANRFAQITTYLVNKPFKSLLGFVVLFGLTGVLSVYTMDFQMFDASKVRSLKYHLTFDQNTDLTMTSRLMNQQSEPLMKINHVKDVLMLNGWSDYNYSRKSRSHLATIQLQLDEAGQQPQNAQKVAEQAKQWLNQLPGLKKLQFVMAENKPPERTPVKIYLYGNDPQSLQQASDTVRATLATIDSIEHISNPMEDGIVEKTFHVNNDMAAHYGLQAKEIANLLHIAITGQKIAKMDRGNEVVDVYVMAEKSSGVDTGMLNHITLSNGQRVATDELGHFTEQLSPDSVRRYQGQRYIQITAGIDESVMSVFKTHREIARLITDDLLPQGVSFEQLGEYSSTQESLTSMIQSAVLALGLTYFILVLLFRSYSQPLVVLLTIPLAYVGVVWGFTLTGKSLSLMGLIGIIGLIGIVVNDALVWIDCYNKRINEGQSSKEAAVEAVRRRFRPIMLTTMTTILGLLPISFSDGAGIAGAMADTVVSGLLVASVLLMFFLPICVVIIDQITDYLNNHSLRPAFMTKGKVTA